MPERFSPENRDLANPQALLQFGAGPRICPGQRFAYMMAKLAVAQTLLNFKILQTALTEPIPEILPGEFTNKVKRVPLRFVCREE